MAVLFGINRLTLIPVEGAVGLYRECDNGLGILAGQGFSGYFRQFDLNALGQHRRGHHKDHQQHQHHVDIGHYIHFCLGFAFVPDWAHDDYL